MEETIRRAMPPPSAWAAPAPDWKRISALNFFPGVATVGCQTLDRGHAASFAVFGVKDYQQLQVIRADGGAGPSASVKKILSAPTLREADGLARSRRAMPISAQKNGKVAGQLNVILRERRDDYARTEGHIDLSAI